MIYIPGVHKILRDLFNRSVFSESDQLEILEAVKELSEESDKNYDLAVNASFLREGFKIVQDNIRLYQNDVLTEGRRDSRGDYAIEVRFV